MRLNTCFLLITIFLNSTVYGQGKIPSLVFKDMGFCCNNVFIYSMEQTDAHGKVVIIDTLGLFCADRQNLSEAGKKLMTDAHWNNLMKWNFLVGTGDKKYDLNVSKPEDGVTGISVDSEYLFIHPVRHNYLKLLQFCPYPYFYSKDSLGAMWKWDFSVGSSLWSIDKLYPFNGTAEVMHITYTLADTATLATKKGRLFCYKVNCVSKSRFGVSAAVYWLNKDYGMVSFSAQPVNHNTYQFDLIDKGYDYELMKDTTFMKERNRRRQDAKMQQMKTGKFY